jgi:vitamin B12 transporter
VSFAQEQKAVQDLGEYVVLANRMETPIEKSGKIIYKINSEDIKKQPGKTVGELLNALPGINIDGAFGTPGSNLSYNIRGGRNAGILILIDGVPISDPSSIANDYDLRLLNANRIESIEVLKGGASTLYGSGASAGVISIKLKAPSATKPVVNITQTLGSFKSSNTNVDVQGRKSKWDYLLAGYYGTSEGISAAKSSDPNIGFGKDGYQSLSGRLRLDYNLSEAKKFGFNLSYDDFNSDYDGGAFFDAENEFKLEQLNLGLTYKSFINTSSNSTYLNFNKIDREFISSFPSKSEGQLLNFGHDGQKKVNEHINMTYGAIFQQFAFKADNETPDASTLGLYYNAGINVSEAFILNAGLRGTFYNEMNDFSLVYNLNPVYIISLGNANSLKLFGSYSTAFISPTLYQAASPDYGNGSLEAEESTTFEIGTSLYLGKSITLNFEYFDRKETNAIGFKSLFDDEGNFIGGVYINIEGDREISGIEMDVKWDVTSDLSIAAHAAFHNFGDPSQFYRIPETKYGMSGNYTLNDKTNFQLTYTYFGERQDAIFTDPFMVTLDSYNMLDLAFSHELKKDKFFVTAAINNLLDEDFVGVYGFATKPINFNIGFNVKF